MLTQTDWHQFEKKRLNFWCAHRDNNVDDRNKPIMHCVYDKYLVSTLLRLTTYLPVQLSQEIGELATMAIDDLR